MVGLSIVLETTTNTLGDYSGGGVTNPKPHQVVNKSAVMVTTVAASAVALDKSGNHRESLNLASGFLEHCFLCRRKLLPAKDIYMYKGDKGFCSVECRSRQMIMDEEECLSRENCSLMAVRTNASASASSSSSSPATTPIPASPGGYDRHRRGPRNREGGFVY